MRSFPKRLKFRKYHKTRLRNITNFCLGKLSVIGKVGLRSLEQIKLRPEQIEAGRVAIKRMMWKRKQWRIWVRLFPYCPVTKKSQGLRMGKGKGGTKRWVCPINSGQVVYELSDPSSINFRFMYFKTFSKVWKKLAFETNISFRYY